MNEIKIFQIYRMLQDLVVGFAKEEVECPNCKAKHSVQMTRIYSMLDDIAEDPAERDAIKIRIQEAFKIQLIQ